MSGLIVSVRRPLNLVSPLDREARGPFRIERDSFKNAGGPAGRSPHKVRKGRGIAQAVLGRWSRLLGQLCRRFPSARITV